MGGFVKPVNKMEKTHTNYPSRYAMEEGVFLRFPGSHDIKWCKVHAVRFNGHKVHYDILIPIKIGEGQPDNSTIIENVDSVFVIDEYKEDATQHRSEILPEPN